MIENVDILYFEDCLEVLKRLPDNSIDAFVQDPPFEVTASEWDKGFIVNLPEFWKEWIRVGKPNAPFIFKATFPFAIDLINSNRQMFKYEWIWQKNKYTNFVNAKKMPLRCVEYIFIFYANQPTYNPILKATHHPTSKVRHKTKPHSSIYGVVKNDNYKHRTPEMGNPVNLIKVDAEKEAFISSNGSQDRHPNRTNPELWKYFIQTYTNENDTIFDGFAGSGSVPQACIETNRRFIACENSIEYFEDTQNRIQKTKDIMQFGFDKTNLEKEGNVLNIFNSTLF